MKPPPAELSVPDLLEEAAERAGLDDWGDLGFTTTLALLVDSCRETAALTVRGWDVLRKVVVRHLRNRLYIEAAPASGQEPAGPGIDAPVVVTGLPRTGTTLLHNLLALDRAHRVLRVWEALHPVPPDPSRGSSQDALVAQAEVWLERLYALTPEFRAIHETSARGPEECDALLQNAFASQHFDDMFRADAYSRWLNHSELLDEYAYYARQLRLLTRPEDAGRRWVLKSPGHLGYLDTVRATFPGAVIVHCHRDPCAAVASYASLVMAVRTPHSDDVPPTDAGRHALDRCAVAVERALQARDRAGDDAFVDIAYDALLINPVEAVRQLYAQLGGPLSEEAAVAMGRWLADHPRHRHGRHEYRLGQFGLSPAAVRGRLATYTDRFPVETAPRLA